MFLQGVVNSEESCHTQKRCRSLPGGYRSCERALLGAMVAALKAVACREESSSAERHTLIPYTLSCWYVPLQKHFVKPIKCLIFL